jgi:hypothetical protein
MAVAVFGLAVVAFWPGEKEPEYQGKKLSDWLDAHPENPASEPAIVAIGTNNLRMLLKWLDYRPSKAREWVEAGSATLPAAIFNSHFFQRLLIDRADERADLARDAFEVLGLKAASAVPELIRQAQHHADDPYGRAFYCLSCVGEASFPGVANMAANRQSKMRTDAIDCIGKMNDLGTNIMPAVRLLGTLMNDSDEDVEEAAIEALGHLGLEPEIVLPLLSKCARERGEQLKALALEAIGNFGPRARPTMPELILALGHSSLSVRDSATNAVQNVAPEFFATNGIVIVRNNPIGTFSH